MPEQPLYCVYLSLGSNLGDRAAYLHAALARIAALPGTRIRAVSSVIETPPWGKTDQPAFLNQAVAIATSLAPLPLLHALQAIEQALGRRRDAHWGPRTLDIDILVYDDVTCDTPELRLPHPFLTQRRFVLEPLAEIAPDLCVAGKTVRVWLADLSSS